MGKKQKQKQQQKIVLPPDLPPEIPDDEVEVSDDDLRFVNENRAYASLLSTLDTQSITKFETSLPFSFPSSIALIPIIYFSFFVYIVRLAPLVSESNRILSSQFKNRVFSFLFSFKKFSAKIWILLFLFIYVT